MSKNKGVVRRIDPLGRLVIPKEVRKELGLLENEPVEMTVQGEQVIIRKYQENCIICGKTQKDRMMIVHDKKICDKCRAYIIEVPVEKP